ncbi:LuxR C-terminal-related transcriptional regulator [Blastococcus sp. LR1]|uniref:helix-turn-helix transcriptional regulator n=1 Tax=Blastococcus sp. LR1 TaxID=2877000 RepID=UPI001CC96FE1|nr:LuxR C-terminal-related transcriptional regulator [Blastococcus sp. LR1]
MVAICRAAGGTDGIDFGGGWRVPSGEVCGQTQRACRWRFTDSELEILRLVATGMTDDAVATRRGSSSHTVRHHMASAMRRAAACSRTELVAKCFAAGVLTSTWPPDISVTHCLCSLD